MTAKPKKSNTAKTLAEFRSLHDPNVVIPAKIEAALAAMLTEGEEQWEYENDFLRRAGIANNQISAYRDMFSEFVIESRQVGGSRSPKRVWFASKKVAAKARETL